MLADGIGALPQEVLRAQPMAEGNDPRGLEMEQRQGSFDSALVSSPAKRF
jgi:hypothetical protein